MQHFTDTDVLFWLYGRLTIFSRVFLRASAVAQVQLDARVSRLSFSSQNHPLLDGLVTVIFLLFSPHLSIRAGGRTRAAATVHPLRGSAERQEQRRWAPPAEPLRLSAGGGAFSSIQPDLWFTLRTTDILDEEFTAPPPGFRIVLMHSSTVHCLYSTVPPSDIMRYCGHKVNWKLIPEETPSKPRQIYYLRRK